MQLGGASASKLALDAREGHSEWDIFVGMTPFLDIAELADANAIVPWDDYIPTAILKDIHPALRRENTFEGKLYGWPFLADVTVQGWNIELVERAGLDPGRPPASWDEYIENARVSKATPVPRPTGARSMPVAGGRSFPSPTPSTPRFTRRTDFSTTHTQR